MNKFLKYSAIATAIFVLTACNGIQKIEYYAYTHGKSAAPTVTDYQKAHVTGVNESNIEEINEIIASKAMHQVDTDEEIQEIVDSVNQGNGGNNGHNGNNLELISKKTLANDTGLFIKDHNKSFATNVKISNNNIIVKYKLINEANGHMTYRALSSKTSDINSLNNMTRINGEYLGNPKPRSYVRDIFITEKGNIVVAKTSSHRAMSRPGNVYSSYFVYTAVNANNHSETELSSISGTGKGIIKINALYMSDNQKMFYAEYISRKSYNSSASEQQLCRDWYRVKQPVQNDTDWFRVMSENKERVHAHNSFNPSDLIEDENLIISSCYPKLKYGEYEFSTSIVSFDNNFYQANLGKKLITYDLSKKDIVEGTTLEFNDQIKNMKLSKDKKTLFLAVGNVGLVALNLNDPQNPQVISTLNTQGDARDVALSSDGKRAYVADGENGIVIVDTTDVSNLRKVANYNTHGNAMGVDITADNKNIVVANGNDVLALKIK